MRSNRPALVTVDAQGGNENNANYLCTDDDILIAAREIAKSERRTIGSVVSDLARKSLGEHPASKTHNGIPLLNKGPGGAPVTLKLVNRLRDESP